MAWINYAYAYLTAKTEKEEGQGMVEYGLIIALISIVAIVIMGTMGDNITSVFTEAADALSGAEGGS